MNNSDRCDVTNSFCRSFVVTLMLESLVSLLTGGHEVLIVDTIEISATLDPRETFVDTKEM